MSPLPGELPEVRLPDSGSGIVLIDSFRNRAAAYTITIPAGGHDPVGNQPALVFNHTENRYILSEIWQSRSEGEALMGVSGHGHVSRARAAGDGADTAYVFASNAP